MKSNLTDHESNAHQSADPSAYDGPAENYDVFNEEKSKTINRSIEKILKRNKVKSVLDITCGTGSQVFWLTNSGFNVIGADINEKMLGIARHKAVKAGLDIRFVEADMRTINIDTTVDAVLSIFNAVGHLTKEDFRQTIENSAKLMNKGALLIFDIFNLNYLLHDDRITKLTIDWLKKVDGGTERKLQYSTIDGSGVLTGYTTIFTHRDSETVKSGPWPHTLQIYNAEQLAKLLNSLGFDIVEQTDVDGSEFSDVDTERILTVARKM